MIPKADGDSTHLGQRPLSVLPVIYRLWASLRLGHLRDWVEGWLPESVFSLGKGLSSVEAWFATALDIEEVLSSVGGHLKDWVQGWVPHSVFSLVNGLSLVEASFSTALDIEEAGGDQLHFMVADVTKSCDTVDRSILDSTLCRLGLPGWFRKTYFAHHSQVRLRFKLAAGLGESWCRDGGTPQGCHLSMVFIVALYVRWCRFCLMLGRSFMLIISSVVLSVLMLSLVLLGSLLGMSGGA